MNTDLLLNKAIAQQFLTHEEGVYLFNNASTTQLMFAGDLIRNKIHPNNNVTWIIDRNVNISNICVASCKFCNFHRTHKHADSYITCLDEYREKIKELMLLGGNQLLLQGGLHPSLGLEFYIDLFSSLKQEFPDIKLHALGPPEIVHICKQENKSYEEVLQSLIDAGLDSLPGGGAEILVNRVRKELSQVKCSADEWLAVMEVAHKLKLVTSATMMFGHIETIDERVEHLIRVRQTQEKKATDEAGFISFILWPFQAEGTVLQKKYGIQTHVSSDEYIRMLALSRIMLPNIANIQASWLTVGKEAAQVCLHAGANDFGSIMIEENVVSAAGSNNSIDAELMQKSITEAGFTPRLRNQKFDYLN